LLCAKLPMRVARDGRNVASGEIQTSSVHNRVPDQTSLPRFVTVHWTVVSSPEKLLGWVTTETVRKSAGSGVTSDGAVRELLFVSGPSQAWPFEFV